MRMLTFHAYRIVPPFDAAAAGKLGWLQNERVGISTTDLEIADEALVHETTLLWSNPQDFRKVPGYPGRGLAHELKVTILAAFGN